MNRDQREVLWRMGGWQVANCLLHDGGWVSMMPSMWGGAGPRRPDGPGRQVSRFECRNGKVTAEWFDGTCTVVTKAQVNRWRKALEPAVLGALQAARDAAQAEARSADGWCMCPQQRGEGKCFGRASYLPKCYHPTDDEYAAHIKRTRACAVAEKLALQAALHLLPEPQPGEQLDMFA